MIPDYRIMYVRDKFNQRIGALAISIDRKAKKINYQLSMVHPVDTFVYPLISGNDESTLDVNNRKVRKVRARRIPFNAAAAQILAVERLKNDPYTTSIDPKADSHEITAKVMEHMRTLRVPSRARKFAKSWLNVYNAKRALMSEIKKKSEIQKRKEELLSSGRSHTISDRRDGSKSYFFNGMRHRAQGPAVEYADGRKEYWYNDQKFGSQQEIDEFVLGNTQMPNLSLEPKLSKNFTEKTVKKSSKPSKIKKKSVKNKKSSSKKSSTKKSTNKKPSAKKLSVKKSVKNKLSKGSKYVSLLKPKKSPELNQIYLNNNSLR